MKVVRASVSDASWTPPWGGVSGLFHRDEAPGKTQDTLEKLHLSAGLGAPWDPTGGARESVQGEESLGFSTRGAASVTRPWIKQEKMDRWLDGWMVSKGWDMFCQLSM